MDGLHSDGGNIRLGVFTNKLDEFKSLYDEATELVGQNTGIKKDDLLIVSLSHNSPACATLASSNAYGVDAMHLIEESLVKINNGTFDLQEKHLALFEKLKDFCKTNFSKFGALWLSRDGALVTSITRETIQAIELLSQPDFTSFGSAKGLVQTYNSHSRDKYFHLYGMFGEKIKCFFDEDLRDQARDSVDKSVVVHGILKYHTGHITPYEIDVQQIEVYASNEKMSSITSLFGVTAHDIDLIEELRRARNEWR